MSDYNDTFDWFGDKVYIEFDIDSEGVFTPTLIQFDSSDALEYLKESYVTELTNEACDRLNGVTPLGAL